MQRMRKIVIFLILTAMLSGLVLVFCQPLILDYVGILRDGVGSARYLAVTADEQGNLYALGQADGGALFLTTGSAAGNATGCIPLDLGRDQNHFQVDRFYAAADGTVYLGLRVYEEAKAVKALALYQIVPGGIPKLLLREQDEGQQQKWLSSFSEADGVVSFAVLSDRGGDVYRCDPNTEGLRVAEHLSQGDAQDALALPDGSVALTTGGSLRLSSTGVAYRYDNQILTTLTQAGAGLYYVDGAGLKVFYADLTNGTAKLALDLAKEVYQLENITDLTLTRGGGALILVDGARLLLLRDNVVQDLTGMLYRPGWQCALILAGLCAAVLAVAALFWHLLCVRQLLQIPLLLRWGVPLAGVVLCAIGLVLQLCVWPFFTRAAEEGAMARLESCANQAVGSAGLGDAALPQKIEEALTGAPGSPFPTAEITVYQRSGDLWSVLHSTEQLNSGLRAELTGDFDGRLTRQAAETGTVRGVQRRGSETRYTLVILRDALQMTVSVDSAPLLDGARAAYLQVAQGLWAAAALLIALLALMLICITRSIRRISAGVERLAAGNTDVQVALNTGDELASLAAAFSGLARTVEKMNQARNSLAQAYLRFVPASILNLLGKDSIAQVDKQTFVSRRMLAMMIWFDFPAQVYENTTRALFDNLNQVIERTAAIVSRKGGVVFNFAYNGYDVVLEGEPSLMVSTAVAVQQEILSLNGEREQSGQPPVTLRIALDVGDMMMGVVGDEHQMEPTAISSSFSATKRLIRLCNRLDANILCTENVISGAEQYQSRYIGKCKEGGKQLRVYEVFDGDSYEVRRVKALSSQRFSEGVYALYGRDFAKAKRIFLELVHKNAGDGGARYYLYLADRLEQAPEQEISLESGEE